MPGCPQVLGMLTGPGEILKSFCCSRRVAQTCTGTGMPHAMSARLRRIADVSNHLDDWLIVNHKMHVMLQRETLLTKSVKGHGIAVRLDNNGKYRFATNKIQAVVLFPFQNSTISRSTVTAYSYKRRAKTMALVYCMEPVGMDRRCIPAVATSMYWTRWLSARRRQLLRCAHLRPTPLTRTRSLEETARAV